MVLSRLPGVHCFQRWTPRRKKIAQSFLSTAKFITKFSSERFLSICGDNYSGLPFEIQFLKAIKEGHNCLRPLNPLSKVKNVNDAIRNRITQFWQATYFSTKNPINKPAMDNGRLLIAAVFHSVHPGEKDG